MIKYGLLACLIANTSFCMQTPCNSIIDKSERKAKQSAYNKKLERKVNAILADLYTQTLCNSMVNNQSPVQKPRLIDQDSKYTKEEKEALLSLDLLTLQQDDNVTYESVESESPNLQSNSLEDKITAALLLGLQYGKSK